MGCAAAGVEKQGLLRRRLCCLSIGLVPSSCNSSLRDGPIQHWSPGILQVRPVFVFRPSLPNCSSCGGSSCSEAAAAGSACTLSRGGRDKTPKLNMFLSLGSGSILLSNLKCLQHYPETSWDLEVSRYHHSSEKVVQVVVCDEIFFVQDKMILGED